MRNYILTERVNLFEPNVYIKFIVKIKGITKPEKLADAVKKAFTVNEAAMSKIVLEESGAAYYEQVEESGCKVTIAQGEVFEIIRENERKPFELERGELMRVFIIPSGSNAQLLVMAHHLAGDGKSIVYFLEDVMRILSGETRQFKPMRIVTKEDFPAGEKLPPYVRLFVNVMNKKWTKSGKNFTWEDYYLVHRKYWESHNSHIEQKTVSGEELNKLKDDAKKIGVSVNSYIVTALLREVGKESEVGIPVNVREQNHSMANWVTGIRINYQYAKKKSFGENAKKVHQEIYKKLESLCIKYFVFLFLAELEPSLIDSVLLYVHGCYRNKLSEKLAKAMGYLGEKKRDLGVTNLGEIGVPRKYGEYEIEEVAFIPPAVSYVKKGFGVITVGETMVFAYEA